MALVAQSFGRESEYRRVLVTILSFYAHSSRLLPTWLFTDNPEWFAPYLSELPVQYVRLTPEKISIMRGKIDFLHRMKIALIEEAFQKADSSLFYADSDTFFTEDPMTLYGQVTEEKSYMHLREYEFEYLRNLPLPGGATFRAFLQLIESGTFSLPDGTQLSVGPTDASWNAGVMIMHTSHRRFLPAVYSLTDQFFPATANHASEQYAFSIMLQKYTQLQACESVIYHYWYQVKKKIADQLFEQFIPELTHLTTEQRISKVKALSVRLPGLFESHVLTLKDNAVQAFNERKYREGYKWALKAFKAGAWTDNTFIRDTLYHTKRLITQK